MPHPLKRKARSADRVDGSFSERPKVRRGLNEKELQGVLQELPGFWESFVGEQHVDHQRALRRVSIVPDSVLLRLLADLKDVFLKEWNGYFQPAHRLVREHAIRDEARRIESASAIADYFRSAAEPWFLDQEDGQRQMPNKRKVLTCARLSAS